MKYNYIYSKRLTNFSRINRRTQTNAEKRLWFHLKNKQLSNTKFRRQYPVDNYILDFYCVEKKLGIELDGSQHNLQKDYDNKRANKLKMHGITLLRFWDNDVLTNTEGILEIIEIRLTSS